MPVPQRIRKPIIGQAKIRFLNETFTDSFIDVRESSDIRFDNCSFSDCVIRCSSIDKLRIIECVFDQCQGSNFLQFDPLGPTSSDVLIIGNAFRGADMPFVRDGSGKPVDNGACGDMIAMRNISNFLVAENYLCGGGEIAVTIGANSKYGSVCRNLIADNDATGIWIGVAGTDRSFSISVADNQIKNAGINRAGNAINQAGIAIRNAANIVIAGNSVLSPGKSLRYGIVAQNVQGICVANNLLDAPTKFRIPKSLASTVSRLVSDIVPTA